MAESQLVCLDDDHVNEKIPESKPGFYYSEEQRAALEQLLKSGDDAFKSRIKVDNIKDFLSAREIKWIRQTFKEYEADSDSETCDSKSPSSSNADSGVHSTYWPQLSDAAVPSLDMGWPNSGYYKGVTRASVYTHPPKDKSPHIKEVVRRLIQEANKVVAVVMDHLTDLLILQDLLDAGSRRGVAVYILLEAQGLPDFLDMASRLPLSALNLRNLRVRTVEGFGFPLSSGRLPGSLCSKYMLVDGEKVMFGSYSFTWTSSRMDRNMITVMTGHVVDFYDGDFRELYAVSQEVDLYREFHINKPPVAAPLRKTADEVPRSTTTGAASATTSIHSLAASSIHTSTASSTSRFQVPVGDPSKPANFKVPVHKYHNPKYSLVFGNSSSGLSGGVSGLGGLGGKFGGSLQDLSTIKDSVEVDTAAVKALQKKFQQANMASNENLNQNQVSSSVSPTPSSASTSTFASTSSSQPPEGGEKAEKAEPSVTSPFGGKKQRSSFRQFLKNKMGSSSSSSQVQTDSVSSSRGAATTTTNQNVDPPTTTAAVKHTSDAITPNHTVANHKTEERVAKERVGNLIKDSHPANHVDGRNPYPHKDSRMPEHNHNSNANPAGNQMDANKQAQSRPEARLAHPGTHNSEAVNQSSFARTNHVPHSKKPGASRDAASAAAAAHHNTAADVKRREHGHHHHHHLQNGPGVAVPNGLAEEAEDTFDMHAKPSLLKFHHKKSSKLSQRTMSLQSLNSIDEDGYRRKHHKKNCIQS